MSLAPIRAELLEWQVFYVNMRQLGLNQSTINL